MLGCEICHIVILFTLEKIEKNLIYSRHKGVFYKYGENKLIRMDDVQ